MSIEPNPDVWHVHLCPCGTWWWHRATDLVTIAQHDDEHTCARCGARVSLALELDDTELELLRLQHKAHTRQDKSTDPRSAYTGEFARQVKASCARKNRRSR